MFCFPGAEVRPPLLPLPCLQLGSHLPGRHRTGPRPSKGPPSAPLAPPPPPPPLPPLPPLFFPGPLLRSLAPSLFPLPYSEPPTSSSCVPLPRSLMVSIRPSEFLSPDFILAGQFVRKALELLTLTQIPSSPQEKAWTLAKSLPPL